MLINSLKYFCEEANGYHIAAAVSLLGVKTARGAGFPVGKVNFLHLYPLSFFEFLSVVGKERLRSHLESLEAFIPIAVPIHQQLARENKKNVYSALRKSARGRDYEESIAWLVEAGLLHKSTRIKKPGIPLSAYAEPHKISRCRTIPRNPDELKERWGNCKLPFVSGKPVPFLMAQSGRMK